MGQVQFDSAVSSIIVRAMSVTSQLRRRVRAERSLSRYEPCLPRPAKQPPAGTGWIHEIKHDGFRIIAEREVDRVRLFARNGHDFSGRFPLILAAVAALPAQSCVLDGEAIACDENGLSVFEMIRWRQHEPRSDALCFRPTRARREDLRREPIETRKATLKSLLRRRHAGIAFNQHFAVDGESAPGTLARWAARASYRSDSARRIDRAARPTG